MSEMYEGVVFCANKHDACKTFASLSSKLRLRLVHLASRVFGIHRVAGRADVFKPREVERVAKQVSAVAGQAIALFYDNRCCVRAGVLYSAGRRDREFGDSDAIWRDERKNVRVGRAKVAEAGIAQRGVNVMGVVLVDQPQQQTDQGAIRKVCVHR